MSGDPGEEILDLIDAEGRTIGTVTRREMRTRHLPHRCTYVLVFNQRGELFIHLRTATKDLYPSHWDATSGGVVAAGESFDEGVVREVREELGVDAQPELLFPFRYADAATVVQAMVYRLVHEGPFRLQPEEVVRGEFVPLAEVGTGPRASRSASMAWPCWRSINVAREEDAPREQGTAMRVLLGSGGFRTEERINFLSGQMQSFFGDIQRLLFVPYALHDRDAYVQWILDKRLNAGYTLEGIHRYPDPQAAVREARGIFVGGGNTFRLLAELYRLGLVDLLRERVRAGLPYLGVSAGANVACPTMKTTNDMPITMPPRLEALGLVPFQINAHYFTGQGYVKHEDAFQEHFGETRDDRIREFHEMNDTPVVGLWEAGILRLEEGQLTLLGTPARIFRKGQEPVNVPAGTRLDELLTG